MITHSFTALTPLSFLERASDVFADKTAIAYGDRRLSYAEFGAEATCLANALKASGVEQGHRVAYMLPNIPEMLVANFGCRLQGRCSWPSTPGSLPKRSSTSVITPAQRCWLLTRSTCRH